MIILHDFASLHDKIYDISNILYKIYIICFDRLIVNGNFYSYIVLLCGKFI